MTDHVASKSIKATLERFTVLPETSGAREILFESASLNLLALQKHASDYGLTSMLIAPNSALIVGGGIPVENGYIHHRLAIHTLFGNRPDHESLMDLADTMRLYVIDQQRIKVLTHNIAEALGKKTPMINELAGILAPAILLQGSHANIRNLGVTEKSLGGDQNAQLLARHLDVWMQSLLAEQNIDSPDLLATAKDRINDNLRLHSEPAPSAPAPSPFRPR